MLVVATIAADTAAHCLFSMMRKISKRSGLLAAPAALSDHTRITFEGVVYALSVYLHTRRPHSVAVLLEGSLGHARTRLCRGGCSCVAAALGRICQGVAATSVTKVLRHVR
jgi:hypothetical protein